VTYTRITSRPGTRSQSASCTTSSSHLREAGRRGSGNELGNRPAADGHPKPLAGFDAPQDPARVIAQLPGRKVAPPGAL